MNISSPWSIYTQTFALSAGCLFLPLYCVPGRLASGLSSGPEASGSTRVGGRRVAACARGPPSGAPLWPGSVFMSVFKSAAPQREKEKGRWQRCHCYFPMCPQPGDRGGGSVSTSNCLTLPCFTPSRLLQMQNVHSVINRSVSLSLFFL